MVRAMWVAAIVMAATPALALRDCRDMGGGSVVCDDGSYGDDRSGAMWLDEQHGDTHDQRERGCYGAGDGQKSCE